MNIDELRHAAERYSTKEIRHEDRSMLAEFATLLLDTRPIDEQWLRETWEWTGQTIMVCSTYPLFWMHGMLYCGPSMDENVRLSPMRDRGQFTALMFGLGQFPITKHGEE